MENKNETVYPRTILGLDVSTACIGVAIVKDYGDNNIPEIIEITHKTPKIPKNIKGIEALFLRKYIFEDEVIKNLKNSGITDVVIEEPLLQSNNINTIATLIRFNSMIAESIYRILGIVPCFVSSYDARMYSFPELVSLRKYNKAGKEYPLSHIKKAIKEDNVVLFGAYPFDIDKKTVMMNMINDVYCNGEIEWQYNKKGELRKENYDACDALICALAFVNSNRYGLDRPHITKVEQKGTDKEYIVNYQTTIWNKTFDKTLILQK